MCRPRWEALEVVRWEAPTAPALSAGLVSEPPHHVPANMTMWLHLGPRQGKREYQNTWFPLSEPFFHPTCKMQLTFRKMS